ncbi:haloacid dehalogenase type II [Amycolatopsis viridis]|uniref:2-haloacid dehalogenase n=1 Tax=Amycolatopsis viridis TaxID=185678 RepID=A0ABX0SUM6_9PSEU|nr:haloacid dehalogenase type II [Amycolatopsis viridis]NIH80325.1 2-haloacid dehalogenase [Amycolatopsis viridis]
MGDLDGIRVIACDIFGTTVDWYRGVRDQVAEVFGAAGVELDAGGFASAWRAEYLPSMRRVQDGSRGWAVLDTLHRESLDALLEEHGVALGEEDRARLVRAWHRLPAWPDSVAGLARLRSRFVVAALSNGGFALMTHLIKDAALPFDCVLSAELARTYKPAPEVYHTAAALLDVAPHEMLMVAAHGWDLAGARAAGLRTAFLERPEEKGPHQAADRPGDVPADLVVSSFPELATTLGC